MTITQLILSIQNKERARKCYPTKTQLDICFLTKTCKPLVTSDQAHQGTKISNQNTVNCTSYFPVISAANKKSQMKKRRIGEIIPQNKKNRTLHYLGGGGGSVQQTKRNKFSHLITLPSLIHCQIWDLGSLYLTHLP